MKRLITSLILCCLVFNFRVGAQLAIAVAKNENGSSVKYSLHSAGKIDEAAVKTKKELEDLGFKDILILKSSENTGHELNKGFYVLIISSRKDYAGKLFVSYGLGASAKSRQEAIDRAIIHLKEYDWGFDLKYGYAIEKEGEIENFYPKEEK